MREVPLHTRLSDEESDRLRKAIHKLENAALNNANCYTERYDNDLPKGHYELWSLQRIEKHIKENPGKGDLLEVGSYCGRSTAILAKHAASVKAKLIVIDPFFHNAEGFHLRTEMQALAFLHNMDYLGHLGVIQILPVLSDSALELKFLDREYSVVHLDGEHEPGPVEREAAYFSSRLNGTLVFHDSEAPGPQLAIEALPDSFKHAFTSVEHGGRRCSAYCNLPNFIESSELYNPQELPLE